MAENKLESIVVDGVEYDIGSNNIISSISEEVSHNIDDEISFETNDDVQIAKIDKNGIYSKAFYDLEGNNIKSNTSNYSGYKILPASASNIPIVVFLYDDNSGRDDMLVEMLETRGLKGTFATIGTIANLTSENTLGKKLAEWYKNGHGTVGHGQVGGISTTIWGGGLPGLSVLDDEDCFKAIEGNNKFLDTFGLPHHGIAYWNVYEDNPHTRHLCGKYYDYGFIYGGSGFNTPDTDIWKLSRYNTDNSGMLNGAKTLVDKGIGQNCIIAFGGHMARTGTGGSNSTSEEFEELLDYVSEKVNNREMIPMNSDDAVATMFARTNYFNVAHSVKPYIPSIGNIIYDNGLKVCTNRGKLSIYDITISGIPNEGVIEISDVATYGIPNIHIDVPSEATVSDVINLFLSRIYKRYSVTKKDTETIRLISDIAEKTIAPTVTENTTGLSITIAQIVAGEEPIWS